MEVSNLLDDRIRAATEPQLAQAEARLRLRRRRHCRATPTEQASGRIPDEKLGLERVRLLVVFANCHKAAIQELVRRGFPAVLGALLFVMARHLRSHMSGIERYAKS